MICFGSKGKSKVKYSKVKSKTLFNVGPKQTLAHVLLPDNDITLVWHEDGGDQSDFNHSWSYYRLQVGFGGVCRCMRGDLMWTCLVWDERSTILGWQATDSIPPQVSRKESLRPFILNPSRPVGCLTH